MDIRIQGEGSLYVLHPVTNAGRDWLNDNIEASAMRWCGGVVCEWRCVDPIIDHAIVDGLIVGE